MISDPAHVPAVFTEATRCADCYKCVRECPVKAVRVQGGVARITAEACVACGHCVAVCPAQAKRVRDDLPRVRALLAGPRPVVVSLAPSHPAAFPDLGAGRLIAGLRALGFAAVGETACGAQEVSGAVAGLLAAGPPQAWISSACPAAVDYLRKYHPDLGSRVTGLLSPLLAHARLLRAAFGPEVAVVFIGPCIAKKREAELFPDLVDACLTFADLRRAWAEAACDPARLTPGRDDVFRPAPAAGGTLYPVEGGMLAGIKAGCGACDADLMSVSGLPDIARALRDLGREPLVRPLFVELLACRGGCIGGPGLDGPGGTLARRRAVIAQAGEDGQRSPPPPRLDLATAWTAQALTPPEVPPEALARALASLGKSSAADELNCGGCGYDSCRDLARALALGHAEADMCVAHTRRLAQGKADALLRAMPAAAVLVDAQLAVVECNQAFARLLGAGEPATASGRSISGLAPLARRLGQVLAGGRPAGGDLRLAGATFTGTFFAVDPGRLVGAVLTDISAPAGRRAEVAQRARAVIEKNLETVQRIAYLLGENAAETEGLLTDLAGSLDGGGVDPHA